MKSKTQKTILIVEDERPLLNIMSKRFEDEGFRVVQASNGAEGLERALSNHPDMILLDIIMPVMDGLAMLKKLREDDWGKDVTVMTLTNLSEPMSVAECLEQNVHDYLVKTDWRLQDVVQKVHERLNTKNA